ncbi:MAG TPA: TlpA disulfide reductase family protein [Steroidobacteraceae bacterium]|nr:TlpA disulfide reductase family protein [Steroidobacteraceae bacterium]
MAHQLQRRTFLKGSAAAAIACGALRSSIARANDLRLGSEAPPARLVTLDGQSISTSDLKGEVVILTFWATWCVPCREELPALSRYAQQHAGDGLRILGFSLDEADRMAEVRAIAKTLSFPVGLYEQSSAPGYGRIWRLPVSFTIDRAGRLVNDGWREKRPVWTQQRLEQVIAPLLQKP